MDFLLLIAVACGLVWTTWFVLRGSLLAGCTVMIAIAASFGYFFWHSEAGFPLTVDRLFIVLLVVTYGARRMLGAADPKPLSRADWVLFAFLALVTASTFSHDWQKVNGMPVSHLLLYWLIPTAVYWVARQSPLNERSVIGMFAGIAVLELYLVAICVSRRKRSTVGRVSAVHCFTAAPVFRPSAGPVSQSRSHGNLLAHRAGSGADVLAAAGPVGTIAADGVCRAVVCRRLRHAYSQRVDCGRTDNRHCVGPVVAAPMAKSAVQRRPSSWPGFVGNKAGTAPELKRRKARCNGRRRSGRAAADLAEGAWKMFLDRPGTVAATVNMIWNDCRTRPIVRATCLWKRCTPTRSTTVSWHCWWKPDRQAWLLIPLLALWTATLGGSWAERRAPVGAANRSAAVGRNGSLLAQCNVSRYEHHRRREFAALLFGGNRRRFVGRLLSGRF